MFHLEYHSLLSSPFLPFSDSTLVVSSLARAEAKVPTPPTPLSLPLRDAESPSRNRETEITDRQRVQAEEATKSNEERSGDQMMGYQGPQQPVSVGGEPLLQADLTQQQAELHKARSHSDRQAEYARLRAQRAGLVAPSTTHGDGPDDTNVEMEVDQLESLPVGLTLPLPGQQAAPPRKPASKMKTPGCPHTINADDCNTIKRAGLSR
ncbi:hypothetical protein M405DRAFT_841392 [Rhizopogon salebrosus TDB-379]|nr:hypothetical protein M405DRAFT_841392 [Rhizopogon salebrosus TDB-379]